MPLDRRSFLAVSGRFGLASTLFPGALYTLVAQSAGAGNNEPTLAPVTPSIIEAAAELAGVTIAPEQREMMLEALNDQRESYGAIRALHLPNSVAPALVFDPLPAGAHLDTTRVAARYSTPPATAHVPAQLEELAFLSVMELGGLVRRRQVTSVALTEMYLTRLKRYDPVLHFVVT